MAIKWKKYEMYGPKKPGWLKRSYWYLKGKVLSMEGLYIVSIILLLLFCIHFIECFGCENSCCAIPTYFYLILNLVLWGYLVRRMNEGTSRPFFMNWLIRLDCDLILLIYAGILTLCAIILMITRNEFLYGCYDWNGYWIGYVLDWWNFSAIFIPMAIVNNAFVMILLRHLKSPELRKAAFVRKMVKRINEWIQKRKIGYQNKYDFEKKIYHELLFIRLVWVLIGVLAILSVTSYFTLRLVFCVGILVGTVLNFIWLSAHRAFVDDVGILVSEIHEVSEGYAMKESRLSEESMIYFADQDLTHVYENLSESVKRQIQSEKMKVDLITNVSHDLKTPLTSIIGYIDLLKKTQLSEEAEDYVQILSTKAERLKNMIQEVFEVSKATSGNMDIHIETLDMCMLIRQILGDMEEQIQTSKRVVRKQLSAEPLYVLSDSQKMYRIYQNLIENALKYSLDGSRIFIDVFGDEREVVTIIKNTASYEMNFTEETIMERFTRGDINRTTEGHGLGLAIVKSFTEACGGRFHIETDGDLFKAYVCFKREFLKEVEQNGE